MITALKQWGNSQGIRIPKYILDAVDWDEDEVLSLSVEKGMVILERAERKMSLRDLFSGYKGGYAPVKVNWDKPMGNEAW